MAFKSSFLRPLANISPSVDEYFLQIGSTAYVEPTTLHIILIKFLDPEHPSFNFGETLPLLSLSSSSPSAKTIFTEH